MDLVRLVTVNFLRSGPRFANTENRGAEIWSLKDARTTDADVFVS